VIDMVKPARQHTRFERARIIGARALQIGMGAPLYATEDVLREQFKEELVSLYGLEEANIRFVLDPLKIALYEYENHLIPIDIDPHED
jgi:DNA-directed RNA polymerase subunit K/omega